MAEWILEALVYLERPDIGLMQTDPQQLELERLCAGSGSLVEWSQTPDPPVPDASHLQSDTQKANAYWSEGFPASRSQLPVLQSDLGQSAISDHATDPWLPACGCL